MDHGVGGPHVPLERALDSAINAWGQGHGDEAAGPGQQVACPAPCVVNRLLDHVGRLLAAWPFTVDQLRDPACRAAPFAGYIVSSCLMPDIRMIIVGIRSMLSRGALASTRKENRTMSIVASVRGKPK